MGKPGWGVSLRQQHPEKHPLSSPLSSSPLLTPSCQNEGLNPTHPPTHERARRHTPRTTIPTTCPAQSLPPGSPGVLIFCCPKQQHPTLSLLLNLTNDSPYECRLHLNLNLIPDGGGSGIVGGAAEGDGVLAGPQDPAAVGEHHGVDRVRTARYNPPPLPHPAPPRFNSFISRQTENERPPLSRMSCAVAARIGAV